MSEITANVNWLAVGAGTVIAFMLGAAWYSTKLFGTKWAQGVGLKQESDMKPPAKAMVTQFVATLLLAWVIGITAASNALLRPFLLCSW